MEIKRSEKIAYSSDTLRDTIKNPDGLFDTPGSKPENGDQQIM